MVVVVAVAVAVAVTVVVVKPPKPPRCGTALAADSSKEMKERMAN